MGGCNYFLKRIRRDYMVVTVRLIDADLYLDQAEQDLWWLISRHALVSFQASPQMPSGLHRPINLVNEQTSFAASMSS